MVEHLFVTDADNTLWDTDAVYRDAQLALLDQVEAVVGETTGAPDRLAYLRELDQLLAQRHHSGLRYPPALLVQALRAKLQGARTEQAVRGALVGDASSQGEHSDIVAALFGNLARRAPLRPGVAAGMARLALAGHRVVVATEGVKEKIDGLLDAHGLRASVSSVLSAPKAPALYQRLAKTADGAKMMVGDQMDRDIEPAKEAGFVTAWFPGGFIPVWSRPQTDAADFVITTFDQAAEAFLQLAGGPLRAARPRTKAVTAQTPAKRQLPAGRSL